MRSTEEGDGGPSLVPWAAAHSDGDGSSWIPLRIWSWLSVTFDGGGGVVDGVFFSEDNGDGPF